jgi:hypothetical protein
MNAFFGDLKYTIEEFGTAPSFTEMPRRCLEDKGIAGPTAAHVIEEVHVPLNLAGLTFTTGSSAFQNIVGITYGELPLKEMAARNVLSMCGVQHRDKALFCYPPLVNVFSAKVLREVELQWSFLFRSSRDAFLLALYEKQPQVVMGEASFIRAALEDARRLGIDADLPKVRSIMVAGAPMDLELPQIAEQVLGAKVYDVYGCQEFGWLSVNGVPVRDDLMMVPSPLGDGYFETLVGGLPMGDSFPFGEAGHVLNGEGKLVTYRRRRTVPDYEVVVLETTHTDADLIARAARSILRTKARVVKTHPRMVLGAKATALAIKAADDPVETEYAMVIDSPEKTACFDALVQSQVDYEANAVRDPAWIKKS